MERKRAVCIDWNKTLSNSRFWEHLIGVSDDYDRVQAVLFGGSLSHLVDPWMRGKFSAEQVITQIAAETGLNPQELIAELQKSCAQMQLVSEEVLPLIDQIRAKGFLVVIASDNMDTFTRWTVPALQLENHFDVIINSFDVRAMKKDLDPNGDSKFFTGLLTQHGLQPSDLILIDDSVNSEPILSKFGIDYRRIEAGVGLVPELKNIIQENS